MPWSDTWANNVLGLIHGDAVSAPSARWLALFLTAPNADGSGGTEVSAGDYGRITMAAKVASPASRKVSNSASFDFSASTASAWGTVGYFKIMDASTSGNCIRYGTLNPSLTVGIGSAVSIAIGQLTCEELTT